MRFTIPLIEYFYKKLLCVLCIAAICGSIQSKAQEDPRYNRFQYHKFHWKAYHSKKFNIYFPADAADSLCRYLIKETPEAIERLKKATIKDVPKNLNIIIYSSIDQFYETNIGGFEPTKFTLPTFVYKGTRGVLNYNGSYADLKDQLNESLARSLWESELKEGSIEDQAKGTSSSKKTKPAAKKGDDIPFWYKEGSIRYFAHGWPISAEDKLRNSFEQNKFASWQQILNYEPRLGGQAFCYFLSQKYQKTGVAQTFFQLKKKKNLSKAIRLITKHSLDTLYTLCFDYYNSRFLTKGSDIQQAIERISIPHRKGTIWNVQISPGKDLVAYITVANGKRTVYVYDIKNGTTKRITSYNLPPWIDDHTADQYPLIAWHKDGKQLYVAKPRKKHLTISRYTADGTWQERTDLDGVDGITSFEPLSDRDFLLTAYRKGQSDIVSYSDNTGEYTAYTDDEYDDSHPLFTGNKNELLFISDRPKVYQERRTYLIGVGYKKDTLWQGLYTIKGKELKPIAIDSTQYIRYDKPILLKNNQVLFTSAKSGTEKNIVINYLSGKQTNLNEYHPYQYLTGKEQISFYKSDKDSIYTTQQPIEEWIKENKASSLDSTSPWLNDHKRMAAIQAKEDSVLKHGKDTTHFILDDVFAPKSAKKDAKKGKNKKKKKTSPDEFSDVTPYVLQLHSAYFSAQVNNDYLINKYQPYLNYQGQFQFPEISGMTKGGFTDLLENHHFTIAYALPAATEGSTFFARYTNTERKIDWGFSYYRKVETLKPDPNRNWVDENDNKYPDNAKVKTHYYEFFLKNPITYDCSLGLQVAVRQDRTVFLATDQYSLDFLPIQSAWSINTLSFNLNKLHPTLPFLYRGFKMDASVDMFKGFSANEAFVFGSAINVQYHQPIYKYITLVTQVHAGYSGGDSKVLYNLGGEDNNVTPRVDTTVHFSQTAPYAFQTLVTPFRGFYQNSLYGNQYFLTNFDLYFPIFQTLIPLQTPLPFINNLQLGMLSDIATAKETWNNSNPKNNQWLCSYGLSARSMLAGYPLKLDIAWPGTFHRSPVVYFSLSL
jgi:hypothetical protein